MLEEDIKVHDKFQFEIKLDYKLNTTKEVTFYNIDSYIFLPNSLDINKDSYKKEDFYNDLKIYIRFKTPTVLLNDIIGDDNSPFVKLEKSVNNIVATHDPDTATNYEYHIKMFCSILKSSIRDHVEFIEQNKIDDCNEHLVTQYINNIKDIVEKYRNLLRVINVPNVDQKKVVIYLFGDEYISHLVETYTFHLINVLRQKEVKSLIKYEPELLKIIRTEFVYRKEKKYPSVPGSELDNEETLYRRSVFKKYMESILFLNTRTEREGAVVEQVIFSVAAGLSMMFATGIAFWSSTRFGNISTIVFVALVVSYMFKDRIKELLRSYFMGKVKRFLYDHKTSIYSDPTNKIGFCRESFDFVKEHKVPDVIMKIRDRDHITGIDNGWFGEKIILYRKQIEIFSENFKNLHHSYTIDGINDIMRFNVTRFLVKMDDPKKSLYVPDGDGYRENFGERVYHINMIIRYSTNQDAFCERYRIVLNRDGIKRIEQVVSHKDSIV